MKQYDVIIVGTGIAGASLALKLADTQPELTVALVSKSFFSNTNTNMAQGGIAVATSKKADAFQTHISDTLNASQKTSKPETVEFIVRNGPSGIKQLENWGVQFDKLDDNQFDLALEGGHCCPRIVHNSDKTGEVIQRTLFQAVGKRKNIIVFEHVYILELVKSTSLREAEKVNGVICYDTISNKTFHLKSKITVLATGGVGQLFESTTNSEIATGDGIYLAHSTRAKIKGMNHIQFHPTALFERDKANLFLISEAVRGEGAYIVNKQERRFTLDYDERGELSTRDILSKAIFKELQKSKTHNVFLDCRHINKKDFRKKFPTITNYCKSIGLSPHTDLLPIVPAAHYLCGGIQIDLNGRTNINGLYAIGECANSGLHGKNRLASNSLLEGIVFATTIPEGILLESSKIPGETESFNINESIQIQSPGELSDLKDRFFSRIKKIMTFQYGEYFLGNVTANALSDLDLLEEELKPYYLKEKVPFEIIELKSILTVAKLVVKEMTKVLVH